MSGGFTYSPTTSVSFSTNAGSVDSVKVRTRCGCRPCATQIRWIDAGLRPWVAAIDRKLHCVARGGARCSVLRTRRRGVVVRERRYSAVSDLVPAHRAVTRRDHPPRIAAATSGRYPGSYRVAARRAYLASHARPTRRCDCERPTAAGWCRRAPSAPMWHAARRSAAMRPLDSWAARYQTVRLRTSSFAITALAHTFIGSSAGWQSRFRLENISTKSP